MIPAKTRRQLGKLCIKLSALRDAAESYDSAVVAFEDAVEHVGLPEPKALGNSKEIAQLQRWYKQLHHDLWSLPRIEDNIEFMADEAFERSKTPKKLGAKRK